MKALQVVSDHAFNYVVSLWKSVFFNIFQLSYCLLFGNN